MALFIQRCFDAVANGVIYSTVALALVIVFRATATLNLAQGEMANVAAYIGLVLRTPATPALAGTGLAASIIPGTPWPFWAAVVAAVGSGALLGAGVERLIVRRLTDAKGLAVVSATVGTLLLMNGTTEAVWRPVVRGFPSLFSNKPNDYLAVSGGRLRYTTLGTLLTMFVVLLILGFVLHITKLGLAFRAVSSDRAASALVGIRVGRITMLGWALAGAIGGLAACLVAPTVLLEPNMMVRVLVFSLVAATLGGLDSLGGALVGGVTVGVTQTMLAGYVPFVGSTLSLPCALAVMVLVLLVRPAGLFGRRLVERV